MTQYADIVNHGLDAETITAILNELTLAEMQIASTEEKDLKTLHSDMTASFGNLKSLLDQQADEIRKHGETHGTTADGIKSIEIKLVNFDTEIKGIEGKFKEMETKFNRPDFMGGGEEEKSVGQLFSESDSYKKMVASGSKSCEGIQIKGFHTKDMSSVTSGTGNSGLLTRPYRIPQMLMDPTRQFRIRDLLNVQTITTNAIEYLLEGAFNNQAGFVPEFRTGVTGEKPQSDMNFDIATATVKTIAHYVLATRQIIADASQLRNYIDNKLIYGLKLVEEQNILWGSGNNDSILGIMNTVGIQDAGNRGLTASPDTYLDHIRNAINMATLAGYPVTGIVMHPSDLATIQMVKGNDDHYIWANPNANNNGAGLWGVPVVQSLAMTEGTFLLGAFGLGSQLWDREDANIRVSEHHLDVFTRNQLVILAEERLAITTYRPSAFVHGSFATT